MQSVDRLPAPVLRSERAGQQAAAVADHWAEAYGILVADDQHAVLRPSLQVFFTGCRATTRHPILMTSPEATLSAPLVQTLREHQGHWVLHHADGTLTDARTGAALTSYEQLWQTTLEPTGSPVGEHVALAFDVVADHRTDERTAIGDLVADLLPLLGGSAPVHWGLAEPLDLPFSCHEITLAARAQMPDTDPIYVSDGVRSTAAITVHRTGSGLRERLRGTAVVPDGAAAADHVALAALSALSESRHRVVIAVLSTLRTGPGGRWQPGPHHPESMTAAYLGPSALGRARLDAAALAQRHHGSLVGSSRLPGVITGFAGSIAERFAAYRALIDSTAHGEAA